MVLCNLYCGGRWHLLATHIHFCFFVETTDVFLGHWFETPANMHPRVTVVARKRSRSFCPKCRWQVTAKHAYTDLTYVAELHEVTWCMVVWCTQDLRRDGCSFMWHQPYQRCKYTTSVDIQKTRYKASHSCRTTCERSESAQESGE